MPRASSEGVYRGTSLIRKTPPYDPVVARCIRTSGDPRGLVVSYERGTPVGDGYRIHSINVRKSGWQGAQSLARCVGLHLLDVQGAVLGLVIRQ